MDFGEITGKVFQMATVHLAAAQKYATGKKNKKKKRFPIAAPHQIVCLVTQFQEPPCSSMMYHNETGNSYQRKSISMAYVPLETRNPVNIQCTHLHFYFHPTAIYIYINLHAYNI